MVNSAAFNYTRYSGIPAGTYTVTITVGTQVVIANAIVMDPDPLAVTVTITDPNPPGSSTGAINITVTGGTPPYSYLWSFENRTTEDLVNIPAGTYTVTVTDSKGCTFIPDSYIVGADLSASLTPVTCNGGSNGAINLNVSFGTPPYTFNWTPAGLPPTQNQSNLTAGTYCVTVTDSGGSTRNSCYTIIQPPPLIVTASLTNDINEDCHGAIDLNVVGGTPPISYLWNTGQSTQDIINLCPDTFCVTITYSGICSVDTCFIIGAGGISVNLSAQQYGGGFETSCHGSCDGSINSTVSGGAAPISYLWSNANTNANLSGLCAGTYTLTVTDASGQTAVSSITLVSPPELQISFLTTLPTDPSANDGAISAVVTGGVPDYTYLWSPAGGNTGSLSNLFPGFYSLTVTDANQCSETASADLFLGDRCFEGIRIITPNDDGKNDFFIITCIFSANNHLAIYNRNGGLVYETNNYQNNWTGVDEENQPIADGGYLWVLEIFPTNGPAELLKGTVNVLRTAD